MVRTDFTAWVPGAILLSDDDLVGKNPYTNLRYTPAEIWKLTAPIGQACLFTDTCVSIIMAQSKHP